MAAIDATASESLGQIREGPMKKVYGIVGTQRSGSNYVCSGLRSVKGLGDPREYFSPVHIHEEGKLVQSKEDAVSFAHELIAAVPEEESFAFKLHYLQFFENFLSKGIDLETAFPDIKIIFLRRSDIIQQAVSLWKAELTQVWVDGMEAQREPHYNFGEIRSRYFDLKIHDLMWERYLASRNLSFLNLIYEDLQGNEQKFFYNLLSFLGCADRFSDLKKPDLIKQANEQSIQWGNRFRNEYRNCLSDQNTAMWISRCRRWNAESLGEDPSIWRGY